MSSFSVTVMGGAQPVAVHLDETAGATVTNIGAADVLYATTAAVRTSPDGTLTAGSSATLYGTVWLYAASRTDMQVSPLTVEGDNLAGLPSKLSRASNLLDLADAPTARANLGLGTAATQDASAFEAAGTMIPLTQKGAVSGVAALDSNGALPIASSGQTALLAANRLTLNSTGLSTIDLAGSTASTFGVRSLNVAAAQVVRLQIGAGDTPTHQLNGQTVIKSAADTQIPLLARVFSATQSVDLQQWQTSLAGAIGSRMDVSGKWGHNTAPANALHVKGGGGRVEIIANPAGAPAISNQGTSGSTTYNYWVVGKDTATAPGKTLPTPIGTTTTGAATLNGTNFNRITGTATGAKSVDILRGATLATAVSVATSVLTTSGAYTFDDIGGSTAAYTVPTRNSTGDFTIDGKLTHISSFKFNPMDYGAVRTDQSTHVAAFQAAINAAVLVAGSVEIPYNASQWSFDTTLTVSSLSAGATTVHLSSEGVANQLVWRGANNSSVIRTVGLKRSIWQNLRITVATGITGVTCFDFDADASRGSTGANVITNCHATSVDNTSTGCIGFRVFHGTVGSEASAWKFDSCTVSWAQGPSLANVTTAACMGWEMQGANTIANVWINCSNGGCWKGFAFAADGTQPQGGQASAETFINCGGSGNTIEFAMEGQSGNFNVVGGRFEAGGKMVTTGGSADVSIGCSWVAVTCARMGNMDTSTTHATDVLYDLQCPAHMTFDCCIWYDLRGDGSATNYGSPMFTLRGGPTTFGSLRFTNCTIPAPDSGFWTIPAPQSSWADWDVEIARGNIRTDMTDVTNGSRARQTFTPRSGPVKPLVVQTTNYVATSRDRYVLVDSTAAVRAPVLPPATIQNQLVTVKDAGGAAATNNITVTRAGSDTIDGATTSIINVNRASRTFWSNGAGAWSVL